MRIIVLAAWCLAVGILWWPVWGQSENKTSQIKQPTTNKTTGTQNEQRGTKDAPFFVHIEQSQKESSNTPQAQKGNSEAEDWNKLSAQSAFWAAIATGLLVIVGGVAACYAARTLKAIEKQVDLMGQQWVDYSQWDSDCFADEDGQPKLRIGFVVINRTTYPLTLPNASIKFSAAFSDRTNSVAMFRFRRDCRLLPNKGPIDYVTLDITKGDWEIWVSTDVPFRVLVEGDLSFVGTNPALREQRFYGTLFCAKGGTRFEEETRHQEQRPT